MFFFLPQQDRACDGRGRSPSRRKRTSDSTFVISVDDWLCALPQLAKPADVPKIVVTPPPGSRR